MGESYNQEGDAGARIVYGEFLITKKLRTVAARIVHGEIHILIAEKGPGTPR